MFYLFNEINFDVFIEKIKHNAAHRNDMDRERDMDRTRVPSAAKGNNSHAAHDRVIRANKDLSSRVNHREDSKNTNESIDK
jgi:hypothetical protein